jgi:hypothetical protein
MGVGGGAKPKKKFITRKKLGKKKSFQAVQKKNSLLGR